MNIKKQPWTTVWMVIKIAAGCLMLIVTALIFGFFIVIGFWAAYLGAG